jgi:Lsr2
MGVKFEDHEEMVSDLDGSTENIRKLTLGIEGWSTKEITLKLTGEQANDLKAAAAVVEMYVGTNEAQKQLKTKSASIADREQSRAIREWANKIMPDLDGVTYPLSVHGRIPVPVKEAYVKAHPATATENKPSENGSGPPADEDVPTPSVPAKRPRGRAKVS